MNGWMGQVLEQKKHGSEELNERIKTRVFLSLLDNCHISGL